MAKKKADDKPTPAFSFDSLADVHADIQDKSPEPQQAAIDAHVDEITMQETLNAELTDSAGTSFDAEQHAVNRDGDPSLTSTGKFRRKRGLSKVLTETQAVEDAREKAASRAAGYLGADLLIHSAMMLGGPEWTPIGSKEILPDMEYNEHENLRRAFGDYFEAKGIAHFSPEVGLGVALAGYMVPRFAAGKETRSRIGKAKDWIVNGFRKIFKRKKSDAAQPDSRNNGERKDNAGKTISGDVDVEEPGSPSS